MYLGKKPTAWISVQSEPWRAGCKPKTISDNVISNIENVLKELNIFYKMELRVDNTGLAQPESGRERFNQICDILVSVDEKLINELSNSIKANNSMAIGLALGYPKTSVEAFVSGKKILRKDLEDKIRFSELGSFVKFALSCDNWQTEIKTVDNWLKELKKHSSIIHQGCRRYFGVLPDDIYKKITSSCTDKTL